MVLLNTVLIVLKIVLFLCVLGFIILYYTGLGVLTNAMFNNMNNNNADCGCTETNASGQLILIGDNRKLNLKSSEVVISKISICVTWVIMILLLMVLNHNYFFENKKYIVSIIILVITIFYFASLGILTTQIFTLGNCSCKDVIKNAKLDTSSNLKNIINNSVEIGASIKKHNSIPTQESTPAATVITIPADISYSIENYNNIVAIRYSTGFGLFFTWFINIILIISTGIILKQKHINLYTLIFS